MLMFVRVRADWSIPKPGRLTAACGRLLRTTRLQTHSASMSIYCIWKANTCKINWLCPLLYQSGENPSTFAMLDLCQTGSSIQSVVVPAVRSER